MSNKEEFEAIQADLVSNYAWKVEFVPLLVGLMSDAYGERGSDVAPVSVRQSQEADFLRDVYVCAETYLGRPIQSIEALLYPWMGVDKRMMETYDRVYTWEEIAIGLQALCERMKAIDD